MYSLQVSEDKIEIFDGDVRPIITKFGTNVLEAYIENDILFVNLGQEIRLMKIKKGFLDLIPNKGYKLYTAEAKSAIVDNMMAKYKHKEKAKLCSNLLTYMNVHFSNQTWDNMIELNNDNLHLKFLFKDSKVTPLGDISCIDRLSGATLYEIKPYDIGDYPYETSQRVQLLITDFENKKRQLQSLISPQLITVVLNYTMRNKLRQLTILSRDADIFCANIDDRLHIQRLSLDGNIHNLAKLSL